MKYEGIIFDWAGTTVDYGCMAPVRAFDEAFKSFGIVNLQWKKLENQWEC